MDDAGQDATPLSWSAQVNVTVTFELFQPPPLGSGDLAAEMVGAVLSIRTVAVFVASTFPAASVEKYVSVCTPSVVNGIEVPDWLPPPSTVYVVDVTPESQIHRQVVRKEADAHPIEVDPVVRLYYVEVREPALESPSACSSSS